MGREIFTLSSKKKAKLNNIHDSSVGKPVRVFRIATENLYMICHSLFIPMQNVEDLGA